MEYILAPKPDECVFCLPETAEEDAGRLVLHRGRYNFVIMNKYPYNNCHLLTAPLRHVMDICDLEPHEYTELFELAQKSVAILREICSPQGINLGFNLGSAAGAGVKDHLHLHVVPRWDGDASFMTVIGEIRTMPEHLATTYAKLKPFFDRLCSSKEAPCGS